MTAPDARPEKDAAGVRRLSVRRLGRVGWPNGRVITCPEGHPVKARLMLAGDSHGAIRCGHRLQAGGNECGVWLYLLPADEGGRLAVEVHVDEMAEIERARMTLGEIRRYLGVQQRGISA